MHMRITQRVSKKLQHLCTCALLKRIFEKCLPTDILAFSKLIIQYIKITLIIHVVCNKSLACRWAQNWWCLDWPSWRCCFFPIRIIFLIIKSRSTCDYFSLSFRVMSTPNAAPSPWWYFLAKYHILEIKPCGLGSRIRDVCSQKISLIFFWGWGLIFFCLKTFPPVSLNSCKSRISW